MLRVALVFLSMVAASGFSDLSDGALALVQDPNGWEYTAVFDQDNGTQAQHQCFVEGRANADECRGTMTFTASGTFLARVFIHGQEVDRNGTYKLDGNQVTFYDELGTKDGPYSLAVDINTKTMHILLLDTHVRIGADFLLESEYQKQRQAEKDRKKQR